MPDSQPEGRRSNNYNQPPVPPPSNGQEWGAIDDIIKQMKYQREALSPDQVGPIPLGKEYRDVFPGVPAPVAPVPPPNINPQFDQGDGTYGPNQPPFPSGGPPVPGPKPARFPFEQTGVIEDEAERRRAEREKMDKWMRLQPLMEKMARERDFPGPPPRR